MECLFADVGPCNGVESSEHLIQQGVGGTLESRDITCEACNNYFGRDLDTGLAAYFIPLIDLLAPLMPTRFQKKVRRAQSTDGDHGIALRGGGIAQIAKITVERNPDGSIKAIIAPLGTSRDELEKIWRASGGNSPMRYREVLLSEIAPSGMTKHEFRFGRSEHRAAAKSILEILDWQTLRLKLPRYARSEKLRGSRDFVRNGHLGQFLTARTTPMYNLEEEIRAAFPPSRNVFCNRVLVSNDAAADRCIGLLQIANTMPLGLCLGPAITSHDFSLRYEAGLFANDEDLSEALDSALISWETFCNGEFRVNVKSRDSVHFGFDKLHQSLVRERGRAIVYVDMNHDGNLLEVLRQHALHAVSSPRRDASLLRFIIEPLMKLRFQHNVIPDSKWTAAMDRLASSPIDVPTLVTQLQTTGSLGDHGKQLLDLFRVTLRELVDSCGYPKSIRLLE